MKKLALVIALMLLLLAAAAFYFGNYAAAWHSDDGQSNGVVLFAPVDNGGCVGFIVERQEFIVSLNQSNICQ